MNFSNFGMGGKELVDYLTAKKWLSREEWKLLEQVYRIDLLKPLKELKEEDFKLLCKDLSSHKEKNKFTEEKDVELPQFVDELYILKIERLKDSRNKKNEM